MLFSFWGSTSFVCVSRGRAPWAPGCIGAAPVSVALGVPRAIRLRLDDQNSPARVDRPVRLFLRVQRASRTDKTPPPFEKVEISTAGSTVIGIYRRSGRPRFMRVPKPGATTCHDESLCRRALAMAKLILIVHVAPHSSAPSVPPAPGQRAAARLRLNSRDQARWLPHPGLARGGSCPAVHPARHGFHRSLPEDRRRGGEPAGALMRARRRGYRGR